MGDEINGTIRKEAEKQPVLCPLRRGTLEPTMDILTHHAIWTWNRKASLQNIRKAVRIVYRAVGVSEFRQRADITATFTLNYKLRVPVYSPTLLLRPDNGQLRPYFQFSAPDTR